MFFVLICKGFGAGIWRASIGSPKSGRSRLTSGCIRTRSGEDWSRCRTKNDRRSRVARRSSFGRTQAGRESVNPQRRYFTCTFRAEQPPDSKKRPQRRGSSGRLSRGLSAVKRQKFGRSAERASMWRCRSSPRKSSHRNRKEEPRRKTPQAPSTKKSAMTSRPARILLNVQSGKSVWDF
jgi:hypothetical protein